MKSVTKEEIAQAKQMDLLTYLASYQPQELVKVGRHEYKTRTHDSLRISENGKWNWCSQGFGGTTALNYLIRVQGMDFVSAVRHLCELEPLPLSVFQQVAREPNGSQLKRPFTAPLPDAGYESVAAYLRGRGIRSKVLRYCLQEGLLYQTTRAGYKNCVFVGKHDGRNHRRRYQKPAHGGTPPCRRRGLHPLRHRTGRHGSALGQHHVP